MVHEGDPQPGFYRRKRKGGAWDPAAIFWHDDKLVCVIAGRVYDAAEQWTRLYPNPITEDVYRAVAEGGEPWPDIAPPVQHGSNMPADPAEALRMQLEGEDAEIERWLATNPIRDEAAASRAADWSKRVAELAETAKRHLKEDRKPFDEGLAKVRSTWTPLEDWGTRLKKRLKEAVEPYLKEKARREAQERAAALATGAPAVPRAQNPNVGNTGKKVSLRTYRTAVITDYDAFLAFVKDWDEVRQFMQTLADRAARAKAEMPGVQIKEDQKAA
jgi:hypothetical protein